MKNLDDKINSLSQTNFAQRKDEEINPTLLNETYTRLRNQVSSLKQDVNSQETIIDVTKTLTMIVTELNQEINKMKLDLKKQYHSISSPDLLEFDSNKKTGLPIQNVAEEFNLKKNLSVLWSTVMKLQDM